MSIEVKGGTETKIEITKVNPPPVAPITITISISAESWSYVRCHVPQIIEHLLENEEAASLVSGGGGGNHSLAVHVRDVTPEKYCEELLQWFEEEKLNRRAFV